MTAREQWQAWRSGDSPANVSIDDFYRWLEDFTSEAEDSDGLFERWRALPDRESNMKRILEGEIIGVGTQPQFLYGTFFGLFQVLHGRKCFIGTCEPVDNVYCHAVVRRLTTYLGKIVVRVNGSMMASEKLYLGNFNDVNMAFVDYVELMALKKKNEELFKKHVQALFLLEYDLPIYTMRLVMMDHGLERGAGMAYHCTNKVPEEWAKGMCIDTSQELKSMEGLVLGGVYSYINSYTVSETEFLLGPMLKKKIKVVRGKGSKSYTYRTDAQRASMLVRDVMQTEGNALILCYTDGVRQSVCEEFRKSGQDVVVSTNPMDILTAFVQLPGMESKKKVMLMRSFPSTLVIPPKPICKGAVFLAEHFLSTNIEEKALAISEGVFENPPGVRMYFSMEDQLFKTYEKEGGFDKLFALIDFTEKYDPWRQIRRVLARTMEKRLHNLRVLSMDEDSVLITMIFQGVTHPNLVKDSKPKLTSKLDAPCFCGSGKPFRECHGKKK